MYRARGMSLVEMVVAIVIVAIVLAASAPMISNTFQSYLTTRSALDATSKARLAVERLSRELRDVNFAGGAYQFTTMNANAVTFIKTDGTTVAVDRAGANLQIQYPLPLPVLGPFTLTDDVTAGAANFNLQYIAADGSSPATAATVAFVQITLTLDVRDSVNGSRTERTRVALRDKS
jgi:prepilin-type N-terminal cleavage/methylation domain-containing protein